MLMNLRLRAGPREGRTNSEDDGCGASGWFDVRGMSIIYLRHCNDCCIVFRVILVSIYWYVKAVLMTYSIAFWLLLVGSCDFFWKNIPGSDNICILSWFDLNDIAYTHFLFQNSTFLSFNPRFPVVPCWRPETHALDLWRWGGGNVMWLKIFYREKWL